jgi:methionyl-tRNA synthetase
MPRYLLTAALPYANGPIHIGHLAGCYLPADVYHRYLKGKGEDVLFICGTDEHGVAITLQARKEGVTPQELVDKNFKIISEAFQGLGIEFTHFSRTSREIHHREAQAFFLDLHNKGFLREKTTSQFYDPVAGTFLADRYLVGNCPHCGFDGAYGDQCEKCGTSLSPDELLSPRSVLSGSVPEKRETNNWFLPMDEMLELPQFAGYTERINRWKSNVKGQFHSWVQQGLQPRSMTRDLDWGVKVPLEDAEGKVLYVWFDAPIGYISATREYMESQGNPEGWKAYWQSRDSRLIHFIGKDNIVFHTLIFPMMLAAQGQMVLPWQVPANEFLNLEGRKLSTSRGWAVWLHEYLRDIPEKEDELRYALLCNLPETKDADFSWQDYQLRVNSELVAILGNFVNRVMVLTHKLSHGQCGELPSQNPGAAHSSLAVELEATGLEIRLAMEQFRLREAMAGVIHLARLGNRYLAETEPWKMLKTDPEGAAGVLRVAADLCAELCIALYPFLPFTANRLNAQLQWQPSARDCAAWWSNGNRSAYLSKGHQLGQASLLFAPIEDSFIQEQLLKLQSMNDASPASAANEASPAFAANDFSPVVSVPPPSPQAPVAPSDFKAEVSFDQFAAMDLRIATIMSAQPVSGADKVLEIRVDLGEEQRTVVSGIARHFEPGALVGRQVLMLTNLAPRKIRGILSQGMLLMAENREGKLVLVGPSGHGIRPGDKVN